MSLRIKKYDKVILTFFIAIIIGTFLIWVFEERFDEDYWRSNAAMRYKMADDIVDSELLIGKTKQDVISLLGEPDDLNASGTNTILYELGKGPSFSKSSEEKLIVIFENDTVTKVIHSED